MTFPPERALAEVLDVDADIPVFVLGAPKTMIARIRAELPESKVEPRPLAGVYHLRPSAFLWCFCELESEFKRALPALLRKLTDGGDLWISWPRGGAADGLDAERIRTHARQLGLKDVHSCAVDKNWEGLKLVFID